MHANVRSRNNMKKMTIVLSELPKAFGPGWQADCDDFHGRGLTKREALSNLGAVIERAEWAARPDPKLCPTCGLFGGHEIGCKDDPAAKRKAR